MPFSRALLSSPRKTSKATAARPSVICGGSSTSRCRTGSGTWRPDGTVPDLPAALAEWAQQAGRYARIGKQTVETLGPLDLLHLDDVTDYYIADLLIRDNGIVGAPPKTFKTTSAMVMAICI